MKNAILGLGKSGMSIAAFLGKDIIGIDKVVKQLHFPVVTEEQFKFDGIERIFISPGIAREHPIYKEAIQRGITISSDIELGLQKTKARLIAITGTKGKTTTVECIAHVLRENGRDALAVGNNGRPLLDHLNHDILVIELSSFQLELLNLKCFECTGILKITPDHLDRYASFEEYAQTKMKLKDLSKKCFVDTIGDNEGIARKICSEFAISEAAFAEALKTFKRPKHRLEFIKEVDQIRFYNDSKGTNVDSVVYATRNVIGPKILIVGGRDKGLDFSLWQNEWDDSVEGVIAIGECREKIKRQLTPRFCVEMVEGLEEAVKLAFRKAKRGSSVILSPGCASFDQFKNFEERGDCFNKAVEKL
jgi:UDP-N-acetylmuramoylalanine--D-glutamate ligase